MEYESYFTMVNQDTSTTQCTVHDKTPGSEQRRINIVVRSHYTVGKVISDITTQYRYDSFDLVLQPAIGDLVYLNNLREQLLFDLPGFDASIKNILILLPSGEWDGNVKQRFDLSLQPLKCITNTASLMAAQSVITTTLLEASQATESTVTAIDATLSANNINGGSAPMKQRKHHTSSIATYDTFNTQTTLTSTTATSNINNNNQSIMSSTRTTSNHSSLSGEDGILQTVYQQKRCTVSCVVTSGSGVDGGCGGNSFGPIGSGRNHNNQQQHNNNNNNANNNNNHVMNMCIDTMSSVGGAPAAVASIDTPDGVGVLMLGGNNAPSSPSTATNLSATDSLNLSPMSDHEQLTDDDLALGASASPTEAEPMNGSAGGGSGCDIAGSGSCQGGVLSLAQTSPTGSRDDDSTIKAYYDRQYPMSSLSSKSGIGIGAGKGYVGLVNQAMTCYLNSLLQALYMTPEFRNGLYSWEFDNDNEAKSIPFQLQKLFLNLQTSHKSAIETTDLTRSFGWDSSEAWQQHDIQELCRVMFDALEHKFKRTKQAELISSLYEGKMIDYVKCLECNTEKRRDDTFLDIPLPVRPFGNKEAYGSIEEALRAFIQPETLDGNNQYHCEKCNKKCDAHKGLKFKCFPYVLTLHLKRFDFNYQTMHRIKINDKVTFPELLNLNSFVEETQKGAAAGEEGNATEQPDTDHAATNGAVVNGVNGSGPTDDCSTTDSGSAMEEDINSVGVATNGSSTGGQHEHEHDMNDEDEGIDMSTSTDHRINGNSSNGNGSAVADYVKQAKGPYMYELFAIMIHSGSASGGHYFAYIKDFETNEWFCFNDQSVTPITQEEIEKSYGGGSTRSYYTSSYSASINAYMLMYRQVDAKRNERAMKVEDFPAHINTLLPQLRVEDENRITRSSRHTTYGSEIGLPDIIKPRVYFYNNQLRKLKMSRIHVAQSFDINTVLEIAYQNLDVEQFAPLSRCRLVGYDQATETIIQSYEHISDPALTEVRAAYDGTMDFLLECHDEGNDFEIYAPGGATWRVYMVNLATAEIDGPFFVYSQTRELNNTLRHSISVRLNVKESELLIATLPNLKAFVAYDPLPNKAAQDYLQDVAETYFRHLTYFYLNVPNTDHATLELLGIPSYDGKSIAAAIDGANAVNGNTDVVDAMLMNGSSHYQMQQHGCNLDDSFDTVSMSSNSIRRESPLPLSAGSGTPTATQPPSPLPPIHNSNSNSTTGHESNSEDSSLSDGDRTLVESVQNRGCGVGSSQQSSTSHSPQLSSPEDESTSEDRLRSFYAIVENDSSAVNFQNMHGNRTLFFHAIKTGALDINTLSSSYYSSTEDDIGRKPTYAYKLIVDSHMKVHEFKKHIESLLRVPANYFKLIRKQHDNFVQPNQNHSLLFLNEAETLSVELGKLLQFDEFKAKIFFLNLSELNNEVGKLSNVCEWILNSSITAGQAKQELIAKLQRIDAKYQSLTPENCRLWLKTGRNPFKIYNDSDQLAAEFRVSLGVEFILQQCAEGVATQVPTDSLTLFVRQWHPDKFELDKFEEITLDKNTDILEELSKLSGIPANDIEYARVNTHFPATNISLLNISSSMSWYSLSATPDKYPLTAGATGNVYFYKDSTKDLKDLTTDERRSLNIKEKIRLDRLGCLSSSRYSPRRERALKIYLDSPQSSSSSKTYVPAQSSPTNGPTASAAEAAAAAAKRLESFTTYSN